MSICGLKRYLALESELLFSNSDGSARDLFRSWRHKSSDIRLVSTKNRRKR